MAYWIKVFGENKTDSGEWVDLDIDDRDAQDVLYDLKRYLANYRLYMAELAILEYVKSHPDCPKPQAGDFSNIDSATFEDALEDLMDFDYVCYDDEETEFEISEDGEKRLERYKEMLGG